MKTLVFWLVVGGMVVGLATMARRCQNAEIERAVRHADEQQERAARQWISEFYANGSASPATTQQVDQTINRLREVRRRAGEPFSPSSQ